MEIQEKNANFIFQNIEKQMVPCKSTAEEVSFEWSHHRISSTDSKVRTTLHTCLRNLLWAGSDRAKHFGHSGSERETVHTWWWSLCLGW